ncbi:hypothetical protein, partial [Tepidimonas taiwanensis]|uniref:hypothetical protein n=1 Tax=Tepidimonas taiwanensis TaxID=307486 RepID=UPI001F393661
MSGRSRPNVGRHRGDHNNLGLFVPKVIDAQAAPWIAGVAAVLDVPFDWHLATIPGEVKAVGTAALVVYAIGDGLAEISGGTIHSSSLKNSFSRHPQPQQRRGGAAGLGW